MNLSVNLVNLDYTNLKREALFAYSVLQGSTRIPKDKHHAHSAHLRDQHRILAPPAKLTAVVIIVVLGIGNPTIKVGQNVVLCAHKAHTMMGQHQPLLAKSAPKTLSIKMTVYLQPIMTTSGIARAAAT